MTMLKLQHVAVAAVSAAEIVVDFVVIVAVVGCGSVVVVVVRGCG